MTPHAAARAVLHLLIGLGTVALVPVSSGFADTPATAAGAQVVTAGPITLRVPADWTRREGPAADNPHYDGPFRNGFPEASASVTIEDAGALAGDGWRQIDFSGQRGLMRDWEDEEFAAKGMTLAFPDLLPGKNVLVAVWAPPPEWARMLPTLQSILLSVSFSQAVAPQSAPASRLFPAADPAAWQPYASAGGDFARFASQNGNGLAVVVPAGNGMGKTGIVSAAPVVETRQAGGTRLALHLDPGRTTSFIATLGTKPETEEWNADGLRIAWSLLPDGSAAQLTLFERQTIAMSQRLPAEAIDGLVIDIGADGAVSARTSTGYHVDGVLPKDTAGQPLFLTVAAQAPGDGLAASLALTGIDTEPLAAAAPPADGAEVLFDGHLGGRFVAANSWGGRFADQAQLTDRGLRVDVPAGNGWGRVGIVSPEPLIWLDDTTPGARSDVDFAFDPEHTSGVYLVLSPAGLSNPSDPGNPEASSIRLHWRQKADGTGARLSASIAGPETVILDQDMPPTPPDHILVSLSTEGVRLAVGDTVTDRVPVPGLTPGIGLRIWALSMSEAESAPVRMALQRITARRIAGQPATAPSTETQSPVPPLPLRPLFPAGPDA